MSHVGKDEATNNTDEKIYKIQYKEKHYSLHNGLKLVFYLLDKF